MTEEAVIRIERRGPIEIMTLNRPAQRNAMSSDLVARMIEHIRAIDARQTGALILAGDGAGFCAGSDLSGLAQMDEAARSTFEADSGLLARLLSTSPTPTIAAVKGFAIGGGLTLAAACDIVVTEPNTRWSLPEVPIGLFPAWGLAHVTERVGPSVARRLSWGVDTLDGAEAVRLGLADIVVEDALAHAITVAEQVANLPRAQASSVKAYFSQWRHGEAADAEANRLFMEATRTEEARASFLKFGKKR